jgi:integrase
MFTGVLMNSSSDNIGQVGTAQRAQNGPIKQTRTKVLPKTDARYWRDRVFQRGGGEYHARFRFGGVKYRWPMHTANRDEAATKARDIYLSLQTVGLEQTEARFKPWTKEAPTVAPKVATVGEFIEAVRALAVVRPTTFLTYERKFRFLVSQLMRIKSTRKKNDYVHGGFKKYRGKVESVLLSEITPERVMQWRVAYIAAGSTNPIKENCARATAASVIRNSKALFSKKLIRNLSLKLPSPLPFDGVDQGKRARTRYRSKVNLPVLVNQAHDELKASKPELFDVFLLAVGAGLRRGEIDKLIWKQIDWTAGTIAIEANEYGAVKTESSSDVIDIGPDMLAHFRERFSHSTSEFVVPSAVVPSGPKHWNHYRCNAHFVGLIDWLRSKHVDSRTPLHMLRKEFGSLVNQRFGIYAASAALRHSNISVTREHYVDKKQRTAIDIGDLTGGLKTEAGNE